MADWITSVMDALGPFGVGVLIALETIKTVAVRRGS